MVVTPHVVSTPEIVSVTMRAEHKFASLGVAEASRIEKDEWYLNRVFVPYKYRGQGIGTILVRKLLEETTRQGCKKLILTPGGYDIPYEQQRDFYLKCGFRLVDVENRVMEYP